MKKILSTFVFMILSIGAFYFGDKVYAIDYNSFNYDFPVSSYSPYSSTKANNLGTYQQVNNVKNDYTNPVPIQYNTTADGQYDYFGLNQSSNKYYSWNDTSINNSGPIIGPDPLVTPGIHPAVQLPVPPQTIISATGEAKTLYFNYYVVQVVPKDVRWSSEQTLGTNYAMQPLDILPTNANFAWAYYSESPGAVIKYVTTDGELLFETPTIIGELNDPINSEAMSFDGYELFQSPDAANFSEEKQTLTYVYNKKTTDSSTVPPVSSSTTDSSTVPPVSSSTTDSSIVPPVSSSTTDSSIVPPVSSSTTDSSIVPPVSISSTDEDSLYPINSKSSSSTNNRPQKEYPKTGAKNSPIVFSMLGALSMISALVILKKYNS